jgi:VIT1/CCC1 family predicted Fe2+/Mn2+ transporter
VPSRQRRPPRIDSLNSIRTIITPNRIENGIQCIKSSVSEGCPSSCRRGVALSKDMPVLRDDSGRMRSHRELHRTGRIGWLRAAVLGANDGIVSTASLVIGVAAANAARPQILLAGVAGLAAGALSMAAGEYVSVSSQADTEQAALEQEKTELATDVEGEKRELAKIYQERGLDAPLARRVAEQLMAYDALGAHSRDELGMTEELAARPLQAAAASAASFAAGAALPIVTIAIAPQAGLAFTTGAVSLVSLAALGAVAGRVGGASPGIGALRVAFWGAVAMLVTAGVGAMFGAVA